MYSLKEAAERTGRGKPAILKAIQKGRISAKKNELGEWQIDPAELHRVYPVSSGTVSGKPTSEQQETQKETHVLAKEAELLREHLDRLTVDRDRERKQLESMIEDLRKDRDHWRQQATALLTDQREKPEQTGHRKKSFRERFGQWISGT